MTPQEQANLATRMKIALMTQKPFTLDPVETAEYIRLLKEKLAEPFHKSQTGQPPAE